MKPLQINFDPFPELTTERLRLRFLDMEDGADYFEIRSDERVMKHLARPQAQTVEDAIAVIKRVHDSIQKNTGICWAVCLKDDPKIIGTIGFYRSQLEHYRTEIGYEMRPEFWGKGIMSEAMRAVLDYVFHELNFHSVEANIDPINKKSSGILERNHFLKEAHFRENYYFNGKFTDSAIYSLLKSRHIAMTGQL